MRRAFVDIFTIIFWVIAIVLTIISLIKNKRKTFAAMKKSKSMMENMLGEIVAIIFLIGLVSEQITQLMYKDSGNRPDSRHE